LLLFLSQDNCPYKLCDFDALAPGVFLSRPSQQAAILAACGITKIVATKHSDRRNVNVFNSSKPATGQNQDTDIRSPNEDCRRGGPGIGDGGGPDDTYPNCLKQGNLLIIQNDDYPESHPNDSADGGCITIEFGRGIELINMALLDLEEDNTKITVSTTAPAICKYDW
jgi:hypothetical protein